MSVQDITSALPPTCKVIVPSPDADSHDITPRWSDAGVSLPHAVVTPTTTSDLIQTIIYAGSNNLKIIPTSGGHGSFVPINNRTIYLPMHNFNTIDLDEEKSQVTLGGGCVAGPVLKSLAEKGWYTCMPNSNAVGVVGALLGGLNHSLVGLHGLGIDAIQSITVIPFSSPDGNQLRELVLKNASEGEEKLLFDAVRGAGHGLGIITSVTLNAYRIASLHLTENKVWTRRLIFSPKALSTAITAYTSLIPSIPKQLSAVLVFIRAPPTAPVPGAPMVMIALSYFGPAEEAERVCASTFAEDVVGAANVAMTLMTEWGTLNDGFDGLNRHDGFKEYHGAFVQTVDEKAITRAFEAWVNFTDADLKGRGGSYVVLGASNPSASIANARDGDFFSARDRGVYVQASPWYKEAGEKADADVFGKGVINAIQEKDTREGRRAWSFANNFSIGQESGSVYTTVQIESIEKVKGVWDKDCVGWSPVADGW
jgi:hypothetical protein